MNYRTSLFSTGNPGRRRTALAIAALALLALSYWSSRPAVPTRAAADPNLFWSIGTPDNSADEFLPGVQNKLTYQVGRSTPEKNWRERQNAGAVYRIEFPLDAAPSTTPLLVIDAFLMGIAPTSIELRINGRHGSFRPQAAAAPDTDERQANRVTYTRTEIRVPVDATLLAAGKNAIEIQLTGDGSSVQYDCVRLQKTGGAGDPISSEVRPTLFYRRQAGRLREVTEIVVRHRRPLGKISASLELNGETVTAASEEAGDFGERVLEVDAPAVSAPQPYSLAVNDGEETCRFTGKFQPEKRWRIFAGLKIHNDIGYTDRQPAVQELDGRNIDKLMDIERRFPFYKFNLEDTWLPDNYLHSRTDERKRRFLELARTGRIGINPIYLNLLTGLCTGEELYRSLYAAKELQRKYQVPMGAACLTDAPSHTWFLPSWLQDAGIAGFSNGSNQTRAPLLEHSNLNEDSPFYWEGADGKRVLTWFARSYSQLHRLLEAKPAMDALRKSLPQFLARYRRADYPVDAVLLYGMSTDNANIEDGDAQELREWNAAYEFPKLVPATDAEYYAYLKQNFAEKLPVFRGDAGAYWEDGAGSSAAETILNRDTQRLLPAGEMFAALASAFDPGLRYPGDEFRAAWKDALFYDEHTWGASVSVRQPDRQLVADQWEHKRAYAERAHWAAVDLMARSLNRLAQFISVDGATLFVFNPEPWERTGVVEAELDQGRGLINVETGAAVPLDIVTVKPGYIHGRFLAEKVPPMGYRAYRVTPVKTAWNAPAATQSWELDARYYHVTFDSKTGAINGIRDKQTGRELVDSSAAYKLNELLYVAGGEGTRIERDQSNVSPAQLDVSGQSGARVLENVRTPWGARIRIAAAARNVPAIETEVTIYDSLKRIDISNRIHKVAVREKEAVYFAFPFRSSHPDPAYEIQNTWVRPNQDQLPGACRDWFATQNAVLVRDSDSAIVWSSPDAPLITLADINRGLWMKHLDIRNGHVFSYVMNNYWFTNYRAEQGGDSVFRYYISSGAGLDAAHAARFSAETRSELIAYPFFGSGNARIGKVDTRMPAAAGSFLQIYGEGARATAFKQAEDGNGYVVRLREVAGKPGTLKVRVPVFGLQSAWMVSAVEDNIRPLRVAADGAVEIPLQPWQFTAVRLVFRPPVPRPRS